MHKHAEKSPFGDELALQGVQAFVGVPATEYVPAAQLTTAALDAEVQADITRWPGPAVEQVVHAFVCEPLTE